MRVSLAFVLAGLLGQATARHGLKHMVACGRKGGCRREKAFCSDDSKKHEVRCCANKKPRGRKGRKFSKKFKTCKVWGASNVPKCVHASTYDEAAKICKKAGARLCTAKEMENNCTKHTGCMHDHDLIWTGDSCGQPAVPVPPTGGMFKVACGRKGRCRKEESGCVASSEKHEVRCCADSKPRKGSFKKKRGCGVYGASKVPKCYHAKTYEDAHKICKNVGARLCSTDELKKDCTRGTGCGHDADLVWTKESCGSGSAMPAPAGLAGPPGPAGPQGPKGEKGDKGPQGPSDEPKLMQRISTNSDKIKNVEGSIEGNEKEIESLKQEIEDLGHEIDAMHGMDAMDADLPVMHTAACGRGSGNTCKEANTCADGSEKHEVRCCAEKKPKKGKWNWRKKCGIYAASNVPKCYHSKTFAEAEKICTDIGARLCTADEMAKDCLKWTGCGHDHDFVWTGDQC